MHIHTYMYIVFHLYMYNVFIYICTCMSFLIIVNELLWRLLHSYINFVYTLVFNYF